MVLVLKPPTRKFMKGYRPTLYTRQGLMLGIHQPLDGAIFSSLEDAERYCIDVMVDHYD